MRTTSIFNYRRDIPFFPCRQQNHSHIKFHFSAQIFLPFLHRLLMLIFIQPSFSFCAPPFRCTSRAFSSLSEPQIYFSSTWEQGSLTLPSIVYIYTLCASSSISMPMPSSPPSSKR